MKNLYLVCSAFLCFNLYAGGLVTPTLSGVSGGGTNSGSSGSNNIISVSPLTGSTNSGAVTISLSTVPINLGGTGATTATAARVNLGIINGSNLPPLFNFNCDSRTATNQENGINMWPFWFMTNVMNSALFPTIGVTNFFIHGSPGAELTQYAQNLSNNPTGYLLPLAVGQKGYSFVDGGVNDSSFTAAQLEVVYSNIYVINQSQGYYTVIISEYPAQPWPNSGFYLTQVAVNQWLVGQQRVAWDFYVPMFEGMVSNMFGDVAHQNSYGAQYSGDTAFKYLFGNPTGIISIGGQQVNTNGFIIGTNSGVPLTFAINGQSGFWNSNGPNGNVTYLRTSVPGSTNYTDSPFSALASLTTSGQSFLGGLAVSNILNLDAQQSGTGVKIGFNNQPSFGWDIGISGAALGLGHPGSLYFLNRQTSVNNYVDVASDVWNLHAATIAGAFIGNGTSTFNGGATVFLSSTGVGTTLNLNTDGSGHNYTLGSGGTTAVPGLGSFYILDQQTGKYNFIFDTSGNLALTNNENVHGTLNVNGLSTFNGTTNISSNGIAGNLVVGGAATIVGTITNGIYHWTGSTGAGFVLQDTSGNGNLTMAASSGGSVSNYGPLSAITLTVSNFTSITNISTTNGVLIQPGATNQTVIIGNEAGNTTSNGLFLSNPQVASTGNQMFSPALTFDGQGWKTTATAASQDVQFREYIKPVQGSASPTVTLFLESQINGGGFGNSFQFNTFGNFTATGTVTAALFNGPLSGAINGTIAGGNATAGTVGEFVSSLVASGSAISLTTATSANVTSISLTAGDWDIEGNINYIATTATLTSKQGGISSTTATLPTDGSEVFSGVQVTGVTETDGVTLPRKRVNISGTTSIFLVGQATFSVGTVTAYGQINARRVR